MKTINELKIEIIKKCPLNCLHCSTGSNYSKVESIDYQLIKSICKECKKIGLENISISGGEPLLHGDILEIIKYATDNRFELSLYTTGCNDNNMQEEISSEYVNKLYSAGLRKAIFSIYGDSQKIHEKYTRTLNSFNLTLTAIKKFVANGIKCEFHFVPFKSNFRRIPYLIELSNQLGIDRISLLRFVPQGRGELVEYEMLDKDDNYELIDYINKYKSKIRLGSPYNILLISNTPCNAAIDRCIINPLGYVFPCDAFKNVEDNCPDYNIFKMKFSKIWENSPLLENIRKEKNNICRDCSKCDVFNICESGCFAQKCVIYKKINNSERDPLCLKM